MTQSIRAENSLLKEDERDTVSRTHFPAIFDADDKALADLRQRVRSLQDKERTLVRQLRRSIRGKAEPRGGSFPGDVERPSRRKQVFAHASKRLNREIARRHALAARESLKAAAQRALALRREAQPASHPDPRWTSSEGMTRIENRKRRWILDRANVGRVSQAGKRAQAARDNTPVPG
jgi:hypothetical protein